MCQTTIIITANFALVIVTIHENCSLSKAHVVTTLLLCLTCNITYNQDVLNAPLLI